MCISINLQADCREYPALEIPKTLNLSGLTGWFRISTQEDPKARKMTVFYCGKNGKAAPVRTKVSTGCARGLDPQT